MGELFIRSKHFFVAFHARRVRIINFVLVADYGERRLHKVQRLDFSLDPISRAGDIVCHATQCG